MAACPSPAERLLVLVAKELLFELFPLFFRLGQLRVLLLQRANAREGEQGLRVCNYASLTAPPVTPAITSLSPNPMTGSTSNQTLTINGSGFVTGDTVKVSYTGFSGTLTVTSLTANQILATINTGTTAQTWTVQVANAGGTLSNSASLTVNAQAPPPVITSLTPNPMTGANTFQTVTINGTGFVAGDTVRITNPQGYSITLQPSSLSATQVQAAFVSAEITRTLQVQVMTTSGLASNSVSLQIVPPTTPAAAH